MTNGVTILSPEQVKICNDINAAIPKMLYDRDIIFAFHHYNHEGRISAVDEYMQALYPNKNYLACECITNNLYEALHIYDNPSFKYKNKRFGDFFKNTSCEWIITEFEWAKEYIKKNEPYFPKDFVCGDNYKYTSNNNFLNTPWEWIDSRLNLMHEEILKLQDSICDY